MTATKTKPAAAKTMQPAALPFIAAVACISCPATFTDPDAADFADLAQRAYAEGWVTSGGWRVCSDCAGGWHLHEPSETVASITGILAGLDPDRVPEAISQVILVHDDARLAGMWCCPRCEEIFDRYTEHSPCFDTASDASGPGDGLPTRPGGLAPRPDGGSESSPVAPAAGPGPEVTSSPGSEGTATPDSGGHFLPAAGPEPGEVPARTLLRLKPGGDGGFEAVPREPRGGFGELGEKLPGRLDAIFGDDADDPGSGGQAPPEPAQPAPAVGSAAGADAPGPDLDPAGSGPGADGEATP